MLDVLEASSKSALWRCEACERTIRTSEAIAQDAAYAGDESVALIATGINFGFGTDRGGAERLRCRL